MTISKETKTSSQQNLDRLLDIIEMFSKTGASLNIAEVSNMFGITRATASSILQSLVARQYLEKDAETGKFSIGYKIFELSQTYRYKYPFLYPIEGVITEYAEQFGVKVNVSVLKQPGVALVILSKDVSLIPKFILGYAMPVYTSASGKALMAFSSEQITLPMLQNLTFTQYTENTIKNKSEFQKELEEIRRNGFATEEEELTLQRCCIAAPIYDLTGQAIASISFSMTKNEYTERKDLLTEHLLTLAGNISSILGYNPLMHQ